MSRAPARRPWPFWTTCGLLVAAAACSPSARGSAPEARSAGPASGPLPEHWVAADIDWLVHVDAQRLAQSRTLRPIFDALAASAWGASLTDMGIDAKMDLTGLTMFGTISRGPQAEGQTTTILAGGAALRDAILRHVHAHEGYTLLLPKAIKAKAPDVHAWTIAHPPVHVALVPMRSAAPQGRLEPGPADEPCLVAILADNSDRLQESIAQLLSERANAPIGRPAQDDAEPVRQDPLPTPPADSPPHEPSEAPSSGAPSETSPSAPSASAPSAAPRQAAPVARPDLLDLGQPPPGCVVFFIARDLHLAHPPPASDLLASASRMVGHVGFRAAVAHDPPVQDAPIPRDGPAQQGLVVFAGLEITGQPTSDPQQMLQLLQGMVQFWTQRTAELARHNPAMLEMLALLEGCTVRATDRGVLLTMERTVLAIDQPQENPYNPALTHKSDAWMPVDAHPTDR